MEVSLLSYLLLIGLFVLCYFGQNIIHELSHLIFAKVFCGYKMIDLIPWPHKHKDKLVFARCEYLPTSPRSEHEEMIHLSPVVIGTLLFFLWLVLSIVINPLFSIPLIYQSIDILVWVYGFFYGSDYSDGKRFRNNVKFDGFLS